MKILKLLFILGGIGLLGYGVYQFFSPSEIDAYVTTSEGQDVVVQNIAMIVLGLLAIVAGLTIRSRKKR
ncbi:hypothetical protein [Luteirhabdus pelagi]|uniref:hypothetical protein n=1 Tax=Luteirhabdus pelagi TaxID=2792783 RepID=UPI00193AB6E9|nr:hypothetical protein [Luteirhabdus pelagi]